MKAAMLQSMAAFLFDTLLISFLTAITMHNSNEFHLIKILVYSKTTQEIQSWIGENT
jgi:hypothetical protein